MLIKKSVSNEEIKYTNQVSTGKYDFIPVCSYYLQIVVKHLLRLEMLSNYLDYLYSEVLLSSPFTCLTPLWSKCIIIIAFTSILQWLLIEDSTEM